MSETPQARNKMIREWVDRHDINFGTFDEARAAFEDAEASAAPPPVQGAGEVVAWMDPQTGNAISEKSKRPTSPLDAHYTIPLYRSPAPDAVVEALRNLIELCSEGNDNFGSSNPVWIAARAALRPIGEPDRYNANNIPKESK